MSSHVNYINGNNSSDDICNRHIFEALNVCISNFYCFILVDLYLLQLPLTSLFYFTDATSKAFRNFLFSSLFSS